MIKTETKQKHRPTTRGTDQVLLPFTVKMGGRPFNQKVDQPPHSWSSHQIKRQTKDYLTYCVVPIVNFNMRSSGARSGIEKGSETARNSYILGARSDAPRIFCWPSQIT